MRNREYLLSVVIVFLLVGSANAISSDHLQVSKSPKTQEVSLQAISWLVFNFDCSKGDTLSGFFKITMDGDLFPGDQTKYDNWLLGGITFLILDEENFDLWSQGNSVVADYERENIVELSWSFHVPSNGRWYVLYINDSVYIKQIELNMNHTRAFEYGLVVITLVAVAIPTALGLHVIRRKK